MSALLGLALSNPALIAIFGSIVGGIIWGFSQRLAGAKAERNKLAAADAKATTEGQKIDDAVAGRSPADNRERLGKWSKS